MNFAEKSTIPCESHPQKLPNLIFSYSGRFVRGAIDLILPPRCVVTGQILSEKSGLSPEAWSKLTFIGKPYCDICADPFDFDQDQERDEEGEGATVCATCLDHPPAYRKARAALLYDEASRPIVLGFKHGDKLFMAPFLARLMEAAGEDVISKSDIILPVPLHWTRLLRRRYNQSALLTRGLAKLTQKPFRLDCLRRLKATPPQGHLSAKDRKKNVAGVFIVPLQQRRCVQGKKILLIDDVLTSGATVEACTKALIAAGAAEVNVLAFARAKSR